MIILLKILLQASSLIISQFRLNFKNIPADLACRTAKNNKKPEIKVIQYILR